MSILFNTTRWPLILIVMLTFVWNGDQTLWALGSQPQTAGALHVTGARNQIEILYNRDGVPRIRAKSEPDALFGLGYVHARDRLWQMEFQRRLGNGRLAEA